MIRNFLFNLGWFDPAFIFVSSKVPFAKLGCEECSYKTVSKNTEAAAGKCFLEAFAQRCSVRKVLLEISQNSQEKTCAKDSLLLKLEAKVDNFIWKETLAQGFPVNFFLQNTSDGCFWFCKMDVLINFSIFTRKFLCWSPFLIQLERPKGLQL